MPWSSQEWHDGPTPAVDSGDAQGGEGWSDWWRDDGGVVDAPPSGSADAPLAVQDSDDDMPPAPPNAHCTRLALWDAVSPPTTDRCCTAWETSVTGQRPG